MSNHEYFLQVGEADRERLRILNTLYNPPALRFLKRAGVTNGMTVLEVGCGHGQMACDLAELVGPSGRVIAIDNNAAQLDIAKETAMRRGMTNIDFHVCDVFSLDQLDMAYDATYGRWVVEFSKDPALALKLMHKHLKPGGILAYEASNTEQHAPFAYPDNNAISTWFGLSARVFKALNFPTNFADQAYSIFKSLACDEILTQATQPLLTTPEQKSLYRLGAQVNHGTLIQHGLINQQQVIELIDTLKAFEQSDAISGFYLNRLISGIKGAI